MNHSDQLDKIAPALVAFQKEITNPAFDSTNPYFNSEYVSLVKMIEHTKPVMAKNGLALVQFPVGVGGVESVWIHESGQWISESAIYALNPAKPQDAVAAISYGRRSAHAAMCNIAGEPDDDGNAASDRKEPPAKAAPRASAPAPSVGAGGAVRVTGVESHPGTNQTTGAAWMKTIVHFSDGTKATTFDTGLAKVAEIAKERGGPVTKLTKKNAKGFGFDLVELKLVAAPEPETDSSDLPF